MVVLNRDAILYQYSHIRVYVLQIRKKMITLKFSHSGALDTSHIPAEWSKNIRQEPAYVVPVTPRAEVVEILKPLYNVEIDIEVDDSSYRYRALMQKPQLVLKFSMPYFMEFPVGTTCVFQNQRFILTSPENIKKQGERKIEYTITLGTNEDYMAVWKFRNSVDHRLKFSMCAKPHEFIEEIVKNLNEKDTSMTWSVGTCIDSAEKTVEFNHAYIDAALNDIATAFETEYEVEYTSQTTAKIHLKKVEYFKDEDEPLLLSYGRGNGFIPGVGRTAEAGGEPVKRIFTQGSDRNIDRSKYGSPELLLPKSQTLQYDGTHVAGENGFNETLARTYQSSEDGTYIERINPSSTAIKEDSLDCSEIYPSRVGSVSSVIAVKPEKNFYDFVDNSIPPTLDFNDYLIAGENMTIIFQSGMLAGKEFDVKYIHNAKTSNGETIPGRRFEIVPQDFDGVTMPNETFKPQAGDNPDKYAIFGIMLPDQYICNNTDKSGASWDMFRAAAKSLYEAEEQKFTFSGQLQALWAKRHWLNVGGHLIVGGYILFTDNQFAKDGVKIRITGIKDYVNDPYSPTVELSNSVSASTVNSQIRQIDNTEVIIEDAKKTAIQYTKRRFRDALETIGMLNDAHIGDFSGSISPVAIQTMSMLIGDESLQFRFAYRVVTTNEDGTEQISFSPTTAITYVNSTKQLHATMQSGGMEIYLQHMTLGQNAIMTQERRDSNGYISWPMTSFVSPVLNEPNKSYYFYARVSRTNTSERGTFVLSEKAITMQQEEGYYHLLCGVLNSEIEGERSYVSLYGFTEILPGRITTKLIISDDGKTYFNLETGEIGGAIKFLSDNGYITIIEGGKIKTELIDVSEIIARSVIVGEPGKQRVEIQPSSEGNGAVRIYDENDNEVSVFEGQSYSGISQLYDGTTEGNCTMLTRTATSYGAASGVTLGRGSKSFNAGGLSYESELKKLAITEVWKTDTPTEISLKQGHIYAKAYSAGYTTQSSSGSGLVDLQPQQLSSASASVSVVIETYAEYNETTKILSNRIHTVQIASVSASASASAKQGYTDGNGTQTGIIDGSTSIIDRPGLGGGTVTTTYPSDTSGGEYINIANKKVRVPAGYHHIIIQLYTSAYYTGSYAEVKWGNITGSHNDIMAKWKCDFYVSRYFANGFCLGTRADNYILAYRTNDGMRFVMENGDLGFDFSKSGIRTRIKGNTWMPLPLLIYKASYYFLSTNSTYNLNVQQGYKTFNGATLSASRTGRGLVTLTFPESWKNDLGTIGIENLLVFVNAQHQAIDARVESITTTSIKVAMSDDASLNDGNFQILVYYLPS